MHLGIVDVIDLINLFTFYICNHRFPVAPQHSRYLNMGRSKIEHSQQKPNHCIKMIQ